MAKHERTVVIKFKADASELLAALDDCQEKADALVASLAMLAVVRGRGVPVEATRETR